MGAARQPFFSDHFSDAGQLPLLPKPLLTDFQGSPPWAPRIDMIRIARQQREDAGHRGETR
ncbi:MAG: hypothetical protein U1E05_14525 [Patescibacteria group bacterium]|nr:hypothetical protein [Patescibacteria group bacterium]